jgi:hypothetical protein
MLFSVSSILSLPSTLFFIVNFFSEPFLQEFLTAFRATGFSHQEPITPRLPAFGSLQIG